MLTPRVDRSEWKHYIYSYVMIGYGIVEVAKEVVYVCSMSTH